MSTTDSPSARFSPARSGLVLWLALLLGLTSFGCAFGEIRLGDPFDRKLTLEQAQHRYTTLVRFSDFQRARAFVAEDDRDGFSRRMKALDEARFTNFESETVELDREKNKATIRVTYTIYTPSLPYEVEVEEKQEWTRDGITNKWRVHSTFEGLQKLALN